MKMWQPDRRVVGPLPAGERDIPDLNRVFSEAFTDRYRRDGLVGVRVPPLNPKIWTYALRDAGDGAMVWRDEDEALVAFNVAHHSGAEGWMGPLAVRPDRQGLGVGAAIVRTAIEWLTAAGATTIGLETMPRTVENIGFYSRLGFLPGHLTVTMSGEVPARPSRRAVPGVRESSATERAAVLMACRERLEQAAPGYDFTREHLLTEELGIGDTVVIERKGTVAGFALWHSAPLVQTRSTDELRVLKLFAADLPVFLDLIRAVETAAARLRIRRIALRCQTAFPAAYSALMRRGYEVRWTDLRMTLAGHPEAAVPRGSILFSNWEV